MVVLEQDTRRRLRGSGTAAKRLESVEHATIESVRASLDVAANFAESLDPI